jgi:hypothetical protein
MVVDLDHEYLLGVTFVGPAVGEMLHSATIAVAGPVPIDRLWHAVPCLPSVSEVRLRLLEAYRDAQPPRGVPLGRPQAVDLRERLAWLGLGVASGFRSVIAGLTSAMAS